MGQLNQTDRPSPARRALLVLPIWAAFVAIQTWKAFNNHHATEGWMFIAAGIAFPAIGYGIRHISGLPAAIRGYLLLALIAAFVIAVGYVDGHPWPAITTIVLTAFVAVGVQRRMRR